MTVITASTLVQRSFCVQSSPSSPYTETHILTHTITLRAWSLFYHYKPNSSPVSLLCICYAAHSINTSLLIASSSLVAQNQRSKSRTYTLYIYKYPQVANTERRRLAQNNHHRLAELIKRLVTMHLRSLYWPIPHIHPFMLLYIWCKQVDRFVNALQVCVCRQLLLASHSLAWHDQIYVYIVWNAFKRSLPDQLGRRINNISARAITL